MFSRPTSDGNQSSQEQAKPAGGKSKFAKNLFADFNNDSVVFADTAETGLFQIPERVLEYDIVPELKNNSRGALDDHCEFEIENTDPISKLLDFESEGSDVAEHHNLASKFNLIDKNFSPKEDGYFQTPIKELEARQSTGNHNLFSSITAKKESKNLFSDFMNSTKITDTSPEDFVPVRKFDLSNSCRKEPKVKQRNGPFSRFDHDYEILEVIRITKSYLIYIEPWKWIPWNCV